MIKKIVLFFTSLLVGVGLFVWVIQFIGWDKIKATFLLFAGWHGFVILALTALTLFFGLWKWQIILKSQGYNLSNWQLAEPYLAGFSMIYLFPIIFFGGEIFKGALLKEKHGVPWKNGATSIIIDKILEATSFLLTIFAGIIFFLTRIGLPPKNLAIILGGFLFIVSALIGFFYFKVMKKESIARVLARVFHHDKFLHISVLEAEEDIFTFFKSRKKYLFQASLLAFLRVAVTWLKCWILILFLGKSISFAATLPILGFFYFASMIPIPAALGSQELMQTFAFSALGLGAGAAPAFTMIERGTELILAFIGLAVFLRAGFGLVQSSLFKKIVNWLK